MALPRWSVQQLFLVVTVCGLFAGVVKSARDKPTAQVQTLQFSPDGNYLLVSEGAPTIWDLRGATPTRRQVAIPGAFTYGETFVSNERLLALVSPLPTSNMYVARIEWRSGKVTQLAEVNAAGSTQYFPLPNARYGYDNGHLIIRDEQGDERKIAVPQLGNVLNGAVSANERRFALFFNLPTGFQTEVWDVERDQRLLTVSNTVNGVRLSPDGRVLAEWTEEATKFTEVDSARPLNTLGQETDAGDFFPDGRRFFSWGNSLIVYDTVTGRELVRRRDDEVLGPHRRQFRMLPAAAAVSPDGRTIAVTGHSDDGSVLLLDAETLHVTQRLGGYRATSRVVWFTLAFVGWGWLWGRVAGRRPSVSEMPRWLRVGGNVIWGLALFVGSAFVVIRHADAMLVVYSYFYDPYYFADETRQTWFSEFLGRSAITIGGVSLVFALATLWQQRRRNVIPRARVWQSLWMGGAIAVVSGLRPLFTTENPIFPWVSYGYFGLFGPQYFEWFEILIDLDTKFAFASVLIGTVLLARGFSRTETGLAATAKLQMLNIVNGDVINLLLGLYVLWQVRRRKIPSAESGLAVALTPPDEHTGR